MRLLLNKACVVTYLLAKIERGSCKSTDELTEASIHQLSEISELCSHVGKGFSGSYSIGSYGIKAFCIKDRAEDLCTPQFDLQILEQTFGFIVEITPEGWIIYRCF